MRVKRVGTHEVAHAVFRDGADLAEPPERTRVRHVTMHKQHNKIVRQSLPLKPRVDLFSPKGELI